MRETPHRTAVAARGKRDATFWKTRLNRAKIQEKSLSVSVSLYGVIWNEHQGSLCHGRQRVLSTIAGYFGAAAGGFDFFLTYI